MHLFILALVGVQRLTRQPIRRTRLTPMNERAAVGFVVKVIMMCHHFVSLLDKLKTLAIAGESTI